LPSFVKVCSAAAGHRPHLGVELMRKFLIAFLLASMTVAMTVSVALADGGSPCCYS